MSANQAWMEVRKILAVLCVAISMWNCGSGGPTAPVAGPRMPSGPGESGPISGRITVDDRSRPGVIVMSQLGTEIATTVTDQQGTYEFRNVDPGVYTVSISAIPSWIRTRMGISLPWRCEDPKAAHITAGATAEVDMSCRIDWWSY